MKRLFSIALAATVAISLCFTRPAYADLSQPVAPCQLTNTAPTVCPTARSTSGVLFGVVNNSLTAQIATVTCYSNANGQASGPVIASIGALGIGQVVSWPPGGRAYPLQLVCQASAAITGTAIEIYVY